MEVLVLNHAICQCRFLGVTSQNITGYRGAIADVFVALQPLNTLNYFCRYTSLTSRWGTSYVEPILLSEYDQDTANKLLQKCELAYQAYKSKLLPFDEKTDSTPTTA